MPLRVATHRHSCPHARPPAALSERSYGDLTEVELTVGYAGLTGPPPCGQFPQAAGVAQPALAGCGARETPRPAPKSARNRQSFLTSIPLQVC
ncbi:hypothetical protein [Kamptonema formosum]|uniref:hypothetical protein n=1 Tax=Kamptonema formosum TaxID=331992 RepID=UPI0012DF1838|nr:hypothetical protein [Oscillatoria sp. PCC 10802]